MDGAVAEPVGAGGSGTYEDHMKKQKAEEDASAAHPINVNGHSLKMGDLYSSHYDRKEMISKLNLMAKASGGKGPQTDGEEDMEPTQEKEMAQGSKGKSNPGPTDTDEPDDSPNDVEDQLFAGNKAGKSQKP